MQGFRPCAEQRYNDGTTCRGATRCSVAQRWPGRSIGTSAGQLFRMFRCDGSSQRLSILEYKSRPGAATDAKNSDGVGAAPRSRATRVREGTVTFTIMSRSSRSRERGTWRPAHGSTSLVVVPSGQPFRIPLQRRHDRREERQHRGRCTGNGDFEPKAEDTLQHCGISVN